MAYEVRFLLLFILKTGLFWCWRSSPGLHACKAHAELHPKHKIVLKFEVIINSHAFVGKCTE
jgi:hypothetical protein